MCFRNAERTKRVIPKKDEKTKKPENNYLVIFDVIL